MPKEARISKKLETAYNLPVGIKDGEIYFLETVFDYRDGFTGATGFSLRPLTHGEVDERNTDEYYEEHSKEIWQQAVAHDDEENSLSDFVENTIKANEFDVDYCGHDNSWSDYYDEAKKHLEDDNIASFEAGGCGRLFNKELLNSFDKVINQDLINEIKKYEND